MCSFWRKKDTCAAAEGSVKERWRSKGVQSTTFILKRRDKWLSGGSASGVFWDASYLAGALRTRDVPGLHHSRFPVRTSAALAGNSPKPVRRHQLEQTPEHGLFTQRTRAFIAQNGSPSCALWQLFTRHDRVIFHRKGLEVTQPGSTRCSHDDECPRGPARAIIHAL